MLDVADGARGAVQVELRIAALLAERAARREFEARASGAEAMVAHLKLMIAKLRHDQYGASSERGRKLLDQMELELEELKPVPPRTPPWLRGLMRAARTSMFCYRGHTGPTIR